MNRLRWYLRQVVPRNYWTVVGRVDGSTELVLWHMWLGRCSSVTRVAVR